MAATDDLGVSSGESLPRVTLNPAVLDREIAMSPNVQGNSFDPGPLGFATRGTPNGGGGTWDEGVPGADLGYHERLANLFADLQT